MIVFLKAFSIISFEGKILFIYSISPSKPTAYPFLPRISLIVSNFVLSLYWITLMAFLFKWLNLFKSLAKSIAPRFVMANLPLSCFLISSSSSKAFNIANLFSGSGKSKSSK